MSLGITVIIPTYNRAHLLPRAISSALKEVRRGDEIIVVDDGSTDSTEQVLKPMLDRIIYIRKQNGGAGAARNIGVRKTRTPLLAFLDSDDEWLPGKLELQRRLMEARPDILFCFSDFTEAIDGKTVHFYLNHWHPHALQWEEILGPEVRYSAIASLPTGFLDFGVHIGCLFSHMVSTDYVLTDTVMVRREEAGDALFFDEDIRYWEDYVCFTRLAQRGKAAFMKVETAIQYDHQARLSHGPELVYVDATITALDRRWNLDQAHLIKHRNEYCAARDKLQRHKSALLIEMGKTREARAELKHVREVPLRYQLASSLPGPMARSLFKALKSVKQLARG